MGYGYLRRLVGKQVHAGRRWWMRTTGAVSFADLSVADRTLVASDRILCDGDVNEFGDLMFATKTGVYFLSGGRVSRILSYPGYGLTYASGRWYAYQRVDFVNWGIIVSFCFDGERATDVRLEATGVSTEVHQIDCWNGNLYIADTGYNRLQRRSLSASVRQCATTVYPNGRALRGKGSRNYAHINSVFCDENYVWLMYHNYSKFSGRCSQIVRLTHDLKLVDKRDIEGRDAHNVVPLDGDVVCCDSAGKTLILCGKRICLDSYTRGIAIVEDRIIVGGSDFTPRREQRGASHGSMFLVNRDTGERRARLDLQNIGGMYEIRAIGQPDFGRSSPYDVALDLDRTIA